MRRRFLLFLAAIGLLILISSGLSAQPPQRIKFRRGAVAAEVTGTLKSFNGVRVYLIRVRSGQTLRTEQVGENGNPITISISRPDGDHVEGDADASCNNRREVSPTKQGDYRIEVIECRKAEPWRGRFTFRVTVR